MCLVTGPLSGELRSPPDWDPEPCPTAAPIHVLRGRGRWLCALTLLARLRAPLGKVISQSIHQIARRQLGEKAQPPGWGREEVTKCPALCDAPTCGGGTRRSLAWWEMFGLGDPGSASGNRRVNAGGAAN